VTEIARAKRQADHTWLKKPGSFWYADIQTAFWSSRGARGPAVYPDCEYQL